MVSSSPRTKVMAKVLHFLDKCFNSLAVEQRQVFLQLKLRAGKLQGDVPACNESTHDKISATELHCSVDD